VFHSLGAAEEKARSPIVQSLVPGAWRVLLVSERRVQRRVHEEGWRVSNYFRYWGGMSVNALMSEEGDLVLHSEWDSVPV